MVHNGAVLQQFTVENNDDNAIEIDGLEFISDFRIRDLDFLDGFYPFNFETDTVSTMNGPFDYGYAHIHPFGHSPFTHDNTDDQEANNAPETSQPRGSRGSGDASIMQEDFPTNTSREPQDTPVASQPYAVACVITVYINGKAIKTQEDGRLGCHVLTGKNDNSGSHTLEVVIAYKLLLLQKPKSDWRNFVISAKDANINHWLQKEREDLWSEDDNVTHLCAIGLSKISIQESRSGVAVGGKQDTPNSSREVFGDIQNTDTRDYLPKGVLPNDFLTNQAQSDSKLQTPENHLEYFAWRHLEYILSVCAMPLSIPSLIGEERRSSSGPPQGSDIIALTCGDMSGHRVSTPASL